MNINCPICNTPIQIDRLGLFKCAGCGTDLVLGIYKASSTNTG